MGALRRPKINTELIRKPVTPETRRLDAFGRDPQSATERLRPQSDFKKDTGYSPFYHSWMADLPRLLGGSVSWALLMTIVRLSLGRLYGDKKARKTVTEPVSVKELAEWCDNASLRDIQLRLSEFKERGIISLKCVKVEGTPRYIIEPLYECWREIEDYAVWKRRQTVRPIDQTEIDAANEDQDEPLTPTSNEAVALFKKPCTVRPGRASRACKVNVGVRDFVIENHSQSCEVPCTAVVAAGRMTISINPKQCAGEPLVVVEQPSAPGPSTRHRSESKPPKITHPRAAEISAMFDPILAVSAARLISGDPVLLNAACEAVGDCDSGFLKKFVERRAESPVRSPMIVKMICAEAFASWRASTLLTASGVKDITMDEIREMAAKERAVRLAKK